MLWPSLMPSSPTPQTSKCCSFHCLSTYRCEDLDPKLYRQLSNVDLPYEDRVQTVSNVLHVAGTVTTATAVAVCVALASKQIFAPVVGVLEVVATTAIANVLVSALGGLAFDAIFQAITGSTEQEESIKHLESACENFIPASERYMDTMYEVLAEAKIHKQVAALASN